MAAETINRGVLRSGPRCCSRRHLDGKRAFRERAFHVRAAADDNRGGARRRIPQERSEVALKPLEQLFSLFATNPDPRRAGGKKYQLP
jgi:hypothetical protein